MKPVWKTFRIVLSLVVGALFALTVTLLVLIQGGVDTMLNPATYDRVIKEARVVERGRGLAASFLVNLTLEQGPADDPINRVPPETWQAVADTLLPADWFEANLRNTVKALLTWLEDPTQPGLPQFSLDLTPVIQILKSPQGALAILPIIQTIPTCPADTQNIIQYSSGLTSCIPGDNNIDLNLIARNSAAALAEIIPPVLSAADLAPGKAPGEEGGWINYLSLGRSGFQAVHGLITTGWIAALGLLLFYAGLRSFRLKQLPRAFAIPLLASGTLLASVLAVFYLVLNWIVKIAPTSNLSDSSPEVRLMFFDGLRSLGQVMGERWLVGLWVLFGAGVIGLLLALLLGKKRGQAAPIQNPEEHRQIRKQFR